MNTWVMVSRFNTMAYVVRVTTGITIASEERLEWESPMLQNDFDNQHNEDWRVYDMVLTVQTVIWEEEYANLSENLDVLS